MVHPYYQQQQPTGSRMSPGAKAALLGVGGLLGWRGMVGAKRALIMSKLGKQGMKGLGRAEKLSLVSQVKEPGYRAYAKKQLGL